MCRMRLVGWTGVGMMFPADFLEVGPPQGVHGLSSPAGRLPIGEGKSPRRCRIIGGAPAAEEDEEAGRPTMSPDHCRWK